MKFYLAVDADGKKQLRTTKADIEKVNKTYEQIDIPVDQAGIQHLVQESFDELHARDQKIRSLEYDFSIQPVPGPSAEPAPAAPEPVPAPGAIDLTKIKCAKCKGTLKSAEDYVRVFDNIHKQEGMEKFILEVADWSMLGIIASSVAYRFEKLAEITTPIDKDDGPTAA